MALVSDEEPDWCLRTCVMELYPKSSEAQLRSSEHLKWAAIGEFVDVSLVLLASRHAAIEHREAEALATVTCS
jgi:hypothetical protein